MGKLTAIFSVYLEAPCLINWAERPPPRIVTDIDGFDVVATLSFSEDRKSKRAGDVEWTYEISSIEIVISREELDSPPAPVLSDDGRRDLTGQQKYLTPKAPEFEAVARKVAERVLNFFKYDLLTPLVNISVLRADDFRNATWMDAEGREIAGPIIFTVLPIPGVSGHLGASRFTIDRFDELVLRVREPPSGVSLVKSLMSDAQTAWYEGNLRRSVLELAIAAEVLVKRRCFREDSPAGAAFDSLEDSGRLSVRVLDLISRVAADVFGHSYKTEHVAKYTDIDHLFRCRNKIAHRGDLSFRNDGGQLQVADANTVEHWWDAVVHLTDWLESLG